MDVIEDDLMCRICIVRITSDCECLFTEDAKLSETGVLYKNLLNLNISPEQKVSFYLCNYCALQLKLFNKFKTKATESYEFLTKLAIKIESQEDAEISPLSSDESENGNEEYMTIVTDYREDIKSEQQEDAKGENHTTYNLEVLEEYVSVIESDSKEHIEEEFEEVQYLEDELIDPLNMSDKNNAYKINKGECGAKSISNTDKDIKDYNLKFDVYHCSRCNQSFEKKSHLLLHKRKKHTRIKLSCDLCKKSFFSEEALETHLRVHSGLPAFECTECTKTFNQKAHYIYHMKGHRNERDVQCDLCGKGFLTKSDLRIHMRVHNDERRYECDICGKKFRAYTHMTNHRYLHSDEKLECDICHQKYSCPNVLRTHIKAVHYEEAPYECETCNRKFKRKHHLKSHYKTHLKTNQRLVEF